MLMSVGTGATAPKPKPEWVQRRPAIMLAITSLRSLMQDSDYLGQMLLHYLRCEAPLVKHWLAQDRNLEMGQAESERSDRSNGSTGEQRTPLGHREASRRTSGLRRTFPSELRSAVGARVSNLGNGCDQDAVSLEVRHCRVVGGGPIRTAITVTTTFENACPGGDTAIPTLSSVRSRR